MSDLTRSWDLIPKYLREGYSDPYDIWQTRRAIEVRKAFYKGSLAGKVGAASVVLADWFTPGLIRKLVNAPLRVHPITAGLLAQIDVRAGFRWLTPLQWRQLFQQLAAQRGADGEWSWGVGVVWMSKNGLYGSEVPFITHTPYVMEALLDIAKHDEGEASDCLAMFKGTWPFLESLKVMDETLETLALSYGPVSEPRMVVNANTYASLAYALHAVSNQLVRDVAKEKALRLARWVVTQQRENGSWTYFADDSPGNFIDCFHTCFVVRNLRKAGRLIPEIEHASGAAVNRGSEYILASFMDPKEGLCRRFAIRDFWDPYRYDLYDQAEYLGLLLDLGRWEDARRFAEQAAAKFSDGENWWCRIDLFGRRWGKNFIRWGVAPFLHHYQRLVYQQR